MGATGLLHLDPQDTFPPAQAKLSSNLMKSPGGPSVEITAHQTLQETPALSETKGCRQSHLLGKEAPGSDMGGQFTKN